MLEFNAGIYQMRHNPENNGNEAGCNVLMLCFIRNDYLCLPGSASVSVSLRFLPPIFLLKGSFTTGFGCE